jgi:hypothetical protein
MKKMLLSAALALAVLGSVLAPTAEAARPWRWGAYGYGYPGYYAAPYYGYYGPSVGYYGPRVYVGAGRWWR